MTTCKDIIDTFYSDYIDYDKLLLDGLKSWPTTNVRDDNGNTPLMMACRGGHLDVVEKLLDSSHLDHQNSDGMTALFYASVNEHPDIVKLLLDHGANPDLQNTNGNTALTAASFNGYMEITKLLMDHGAKLDIRNNRGHTALTLAYHHDNIRKMLSDAQPDNQYKDAVNMTKTYDVK
jgi:ankyrin repeat protein